MAWPQARDLLRACDYEAPDGTRTARVQRGPHGWIVWLRGPRGTQRQEHPTRPAAREVARTWCATGWTLGRRGNRKTP